MTPLVRVALSAVAAVACLSLAACQQPPLPRDVVGADGTAGPVVSPRPESSPVAPSSPTAASSPPDASSPAAEPSSPTASPGGSPPPTRSPAPPAAPRPGAAPVTDPDDPAWQGVEGPPRVFISGHGMNALATDASRDGEWTYVRENLDGIWGNFAHMGADTRCALFRKIETRTVIYERPLGSGDKPWPPSPDSFDSFTRNCPDVTIHNEAPAFYTKDPAAWTGRSVDEARRHLVDGPGATFDGVMTGWQPGAWSRPFTGSALIAAETADGLFVECPQARCTGSDMRQDILRLFTMARETNQRVIIFNSRHQDGDGWLAKSQHMYNMLREANLWRTNDVFAVVPYQGTYRLTPEVDPDGSYADTATGIAYWALQQEWGPGDHTTPEVLQRPRTPAED